MPRIFASSKFQAAFLGMLAALPGFIFAVTDHGTTRQEKQQAVEHYTEIVVGVIGLAIIGTAGEDISKNWNVNPPPAPQVNVGSDVTNSAPTPPASPQPPAIPTGISPPRTVTLKDGSTALLTLLTVAHDPATPEKKAP